MAGEALNEPATIKGEHLGFQLVPRIDAAIANMKALKYNSKVDLNTRVLAIAALEHYKDLAEKQGVSIFNYPEGEDIG